MSTDSWTLLEAATTVLAVHAHPDDETLSTGALLASLAASGTRVELLTATRGEEGEVVPGSIGPAENRPLEEVRDEEIERACEALGIARRHVLGTDPALAPDAAPRRYRDSGMQWVREGLAGPSPSAGPDSFTHRPREDAIADLHALIIAVEPQVIVGYDDEGTYGHPDHVHAHHVTRAAGERAGIPVLEVSSAPRSSAAAGFTWREQPGSREAVRTALLSYRTQLTVTDQGPDPDPGTLTVRHVGGQDDVIALRTGLRLTR